MKLVKKMYLSNLAFLILPLLLMVIALFFTSSFLYKNMIYESNIRRLKHLTDYARRIFASNLSETDLSKDICPDGMVLFVNKEYDYKNGTGQDLSPMMYRNLLKERDWKNVEQGQLVNLNDKEYYFYSNHIPGTDNKLFYFKEKENLDIFLNKFQYTLLALSLALILVFIYIHKKVSQRVSKPFEEVLELIKTESNHPLTEDLIKTVRKDELIAIKDYIAGINEILKKQDVKLKQNLFSVMDILIDLLEIKDSYTASHSKQVRKYSVGIAEMMGLDEKQIQDIAFAATLHDIGKIGVAHNILNKPGQLTTQEFTIIKQHPVAADNVLKHIDDLEDICKIIRHHHEKFDGTGYPDKLTGEEIPLGARIVSVADAFDAMTSNRPYRRALSFEAGIDILQKERGRQFDPQIVDYFIRYLYQQSLFNRVAATQGD